MTKHERIKQISAELLEMFPVGETITLAARRDRKPTLMIQTVGNYADASEIMRELGVNKRTKQVHHPEDPWNVLIGESEGVEFDVYSDGLPPSCRLVRKIEKIPKAITSETGDFIEVERMEIQCGAAKEVSV